MVIAFMLLKGLVALYFGAILDLTALICPMRVQLQLLKFDTPVRAMAEADCRSAWPRG